MLTPGSGPQVDVTDLDGKDDKGNDRLVNGSTYLDTNPIDLEPDNLQKNTLGGYGLLYVDNDVARVLEFELNGGNYDVLEIKSGLQTKKANVKDKFRAALSFISTVLHEGVHYGRFKTRKGNYAQKDGIEYPEEGKEFENDGYDKQIDRLKIQDMQEK